MTKQPQKKRFSNLLKLTVLLGASAIGLQPKVLDSLIALADTASQFFTSSGKGP
jgi:hypothetical protein